MRLFAIALTIVSETPRPKPPLSPRTWPSWLSFGLIHLAVQLLPHSGLLTLSRTIARLLYPLARRRRRIADINIKLAFPELDSQQRQQLIRDHFAATMMGLFEMGMAWWLPDTRLQEMVEIKGMEHLEAGLARGKGVMLLSPHFTCLELAGRLYAMNISHPWTGMYRQHENPVIEYFFQRYRSTFFKALVPRDDVRNFARTLKRNETAWFATDQNFRKRGHVKAPFFGIDAPTHPVAGKLAKMSGAAAVPFEYRRLPGSGRYVLEFHPILEGFPTGDDVADITRVNQEYEAMIRKSPEQYFWMHRRYKLREEGVKDVYQQAGL